MLYDNLAQDLYSQICRIPLIDPHSHINPHQPTARTLDDILGYHYYTELAHSAGMEKSVLAGDVDPRERVRAILYQMSHFDNTVQYSWFIEICRAFFGFNDDRLTIADATWLSDTAERLMGQPGWEERVLRQANIEKVILTNDFDDHLEGFNNKRYIPCLRTDDLVFHLGQPEVQRRLAKTTGVEVADVAGLRKALEALFQRFASKEARACAISLPPDFSPDRVATPELAKALSATALAPDPSDRSRALSQVRAAGVFWMLAEFCRDFKLPFDLMIGVNRRVYQAGVYQGQDLFDQRTSLIQYASLFNAFPEVTFCVSVLSSGQNQELVSYSWIFPNVITNGHWWYANIPAYVEQDCRARLQAVPKTKQLGYYSDMYKLEFGLPKFNMYRRILAKVLADDFIRPRLFSENQALALARLLLRDNARRIFNL
jgi:glucuronate isomerase